jgi:hypothetical protein
MSKYEQTVKSTLLQVALSLLLAIASLAFALVSAATLNGNSLKVNLILSGAGMTIFALVAQNRHNHFNALLTPNTFSSDEFNEVFQKYKRYKASHGQVLLLLAIAGAVLCVYASLNS